MSTKIRKIERNTHKKKPKKSGSKTSLYEGDKMLVFNASIGAHIQHEKHIHSIKYD
jgi:hypothetical protein